VLKCNHKNSENQKIPDIKIMPREILPEGTIRITAQGAKYIKENGRWVYVKKPKKPKKIKERPRVKYDYPPVRIPKGMKETEFSGYYITKDGKAYREPGRYDRNEQHGKINEYGLIYLKPALRGHPGRPEHQYECINISIRDENGKFVKQIKRSIHQLVASAFVPNPEGYNEIDHIDRDNRNNHYTNLRWCDHSENMRNKQFLSYTITDLISGQVWKGENIMDWVRENFDLVKPRLRTKTQGWKYVGKHMANSRSKGNAIWKFKVEY